MPVPPPSEAFTATECKLIQRLRTPAQVQRWLTLMPYNWERQGGTMRSFREVVKRNEVHCLEAAGGGRYAFCRRGSEKNGSPLSGGGGGGRSDSRPARFPAVAPGYRVRRPA